MLLAQHGDYVVFRGVSHCWYAEEAPVLGGPLAIRPWLCPY